MAARSIDEINITNWQDTGQTTPFDLASYSQLVNLPGINPPATDMRGTGTVGAQREWGPLECDPGLEISAGHGGVFSRLRLHL